MKEEVYIHRSLETGGTTQHAGPLGGAAGPNRGRRGEEKGPGMTLDRGLPGKASAPGKELSRFRID